MNQETIGGATFVLPPRAEQRAIARVLGALDDKIELNRRMNRTLEELAAAFFRSWFVDFDPVVAKAAGRPPTLLRPDLAALFPAKFQDSSVGPIPHGWRVGNVAELAWLTRGGINPGEFPMETFDHYSIPAFDDGRFPKLELGGSIKSNKFPLPPGCVMISKLNPDTPRIWLPDVTGDRQMVAPYEKRLRTNRSAFNKYPLTRELLVKLNELGEKGLRERREILRRVVEFQDFSVCWERDQAPARGLVAQVRDLVNVRDTFTRINLERE